MIFTSPQYLLLLPIAVGLLWLLLRRLDAGARQDAFAFSELAVAEQAFGRNIILERSIRGLILAGLAFACFALSGPRVIVTMPERGGTIVLCVDTSGSMASDDIEPTRAEAALKAAHLFVKYLPEGVKVGIVSFSTLASPVIAPEEVHELIDRGVDRIPSPNGATAIGDALQVSLSMLPPKGRRAIVLLTDGINNHGSDPTESAQLMAQRHITLYTVGIGTKDSGKLVPGTHEAADADPDALRNYAELTGGKFFAVSDAEEIASAFIRLSRETTWQAHPVDLSLYAALSGAALLLVGLLVGLIAGRIPYL